MARKIWLCLFMGAILLGVPHGVLASGNRYQVIYSPNTPARVYPIEAVMRSPTKKSTYDLIFEEELRINLIGYSVLRNIQNARMYPALPFLYVHLTPLLQDRYKTVDYCGVMVVGQIPGFSDKMLDVKRGDEILSVGGQKIFSGNQLRKVVLRLGDKTEVEIGFRRGERTWKEILPLVHLPLPMPIVVEPGNRDVNAYVLGTGTIHISNGMVDFVDNDDELALIIAHEIAHWVNGHMEKTVTNDVWSSVAGAVIGATAEYYSRGSGGIVAEKTAALLRAPYSRELEYDADEKGLKYIAQAGFSVKDAYLIWNKFENYIPPSDEFFMLKTHPAYPDRLERLKKIALEQDSKA